MKGLLLSLFPPAVPGAPAGATVAAARERGRWSRAVAAPAASLLCTSQDRSLKCCLQWRQHPRLTGTAAAQRRRTLLSELSKSQAAPPQLTVQLQSSFCPVAVCWVGGEETQCPAAPEQNLLISAACSLPG